METNDKVIERIRKLLALAERGGTEAEADSAMAKVQELLTAHNLEIDAIREKAEVTFTREHKDFPWNQSWIREAYAAIGRLYFCKFYYTPMGTKLQRLYLIGEPVNIMTAQYVADVVIATGNRLAKEYATETRLEYIENWGDSAATRGEATGAAISASNGFKKGYAQRISLRCYELRQEAIKKEKRAATATGTALVLADFYERNKKQLDIYAEQELGLELVSGAGMNSGNSNHMGAGANAANSVNLRAGGVGHSGGALLLGGKK